MRLPAVLLLLPIVSAELVPRADPTAPWVSVDDDGQPQTTFTPTSTVVDGTPSVVNGAPYDLTATVFTVSTRGDLSTFTSSVPPPTAAAQSGAGAFPKCSNATGFICDPVEASVLQPGKTYYVTWDPDSALLHDYAKNGSFEISVRGDYVNATNGNITGKAFESDSSSPLAWGFYPWTVPSSLLSGGHSPGTNITLSFRVSASGSRERKPVANNVRTVVVQKPPPPYVPSEHKQADALTLMIALPMVFGFILIIAVGAFVCMRRHRKIDLGDAVSRARRGRLGRMSAARRARKDRLAKVDVAPIPLNEDIAGNRDRYRDDEWEVQGSGNAFRDEVKRQDLERS